MDALDGLDTVLDSLPRDGWGFAGLVVLCLAIYAMYRQRIDDRIDERIRGLHVDVKAVRSQVVNSHADTPDAPNVRDDIHLLKADLEMVKSDVRSVVASLADWAPFISIVTAISEDIRILRADLADEGASRRSFSADVRADMASHRDGMSELRRRIHDAGRG